MLAMIDRKLATCVTDAWAAFASTLGNRRSERFADKRIVDYA